MIDNSTFNIRDFSAKLSGIRRNFVDHAALWFLLKIRLCSNPRATWLLTPFLRKFFNSLLSSDTEKRLSKASVLSSDFSQNLAKGEWYILSDIQDGMINILPRSVQEKEFSIIYYLNSLEELHFWTKRLQWRDFCHLRLRDTLSLSAFNFQKVWLKTFKIHF